MQKFLQTLTLVALLAVPWVAQGQSAKVSEYDGSSDTVTYSTIVGTSGATAWGADGQTAGYVDIAMPFGMQFGETAIAANSTLRVYGNGSAEFSSLTGSLLAPLYYASGYTTTATSVYYKSTSQMLTVEWRKVTASGENSYSFQLKLYSGGDIEFCYGPMTISGSISVFTGLRSSSEDVFRARGEGSATDWNTLERAIDYTTRTLSSTYAPYYNTTTREGIVYTFTQPACVKPSSATATATAWNTIKVDWTVSSPGSGYELKYSTNADFDPNTEGTSKSVNNGSALTYNITGLLGSTTYYIYVRKICSGTPSGWSPMATATTPQSCFDANWPSVNSEGVITWTSPNELVTSYDVKYGVAGFDPETEGTAVNNITGLTTTLPVSSLTPATSYEIYLRTHCSASNLTTDWVGPITFNTPCAVIAVNATTPFLQQFNDYSIPLCWSEDVVAGTNHWNFNGSQATFTYTPDASSRLITPTFNLSSTAAYQVEFYHAEVDYSGVCDSLWLYYRTSPTADWVRLAQYGNHTSSLEKATVLLPNPTSTYQLAFVSYGMDGNNVYLGDVRVRVQPYCLDPSNLAIDSHTGNSVTLSWTANGPATAWQIAYGHLATEDDYTIINATTNPFTVSNLGLGDWYFFVRSDCGSEQSEDWIGPVSQTFGYCTPTCSSHDGSGIGGVTFGNELVVNDNTATTADTRYQNHSDMIGDVFAGVDVEVNITYRTGYTYGTIIWVDWNDDMDFDDEGEVVYRGQSASSNPTTLTATFTVPATAALGDHRMRIAGADSYFDSYVSNPSSTPSACFTATWCVCRDYTIRVVPAPSCFLPSGLVASNVTATSATLAWDEVGLSTQWEVKYGPRGFDPYEEGNSVIVNNNPTVELTYLEMACNYDAYVRAICTPEGPTAWSSVCEFKTLCPNGGEVTIGSGTTTNSYLPTYEYYNYSLSEQIYTTEEIGGANTFTSISFNVVSGAKTATRNVDIYLLETEKVDFSSTSDWVSVGDAAPVFSGALTPSETGWMTFEFSTPFVYSGTKNLMVVVYDHTGSYASGTHPGYAVSNAPASNMSLYKYQDGTGISPVNMTITGTRLSVRNNIKLGASCDMGPCNPPTTAIALSETEYAATLTFTDVNEETNPVYGMVWGVQGFNPETAGTTVSPITTGTYTLSNLAAETTYDVYVYAICDNTPGRKLRYTFTTPFIPNCKTPVELEASNITYNTANLTWRQPGDVPQNWTVRYATADFNPATADAADYTELTVQGSANPAAQLTGLVAGTTYYIYVKATCATAPQLDESPWSAVSTMNPAYTFTTPACVTPSAVVASNVTNSSAVISWTENGVATAWTLKYGQAGFDPETEGTAVACTDTTKEITGLDAYTTYNVYVKSNCTATDESGWSEGVVFMTVCPDGGDVEITGINAGTQYTIPVNTYYNYSYTQQIITADEIPGATTIQGLSLQYSYSQPLDPTKYDVTIYIGTTDKASFASNTDFVDPATLTSVWHGTFNVEQGWNNFIFDTPFEYDGSSNIVIAFDDNLTGYNSSSHKYNTMTTDLPMALSYYSDSQNPDATSATTLSAFTGTKSTYTYRNVMKLMANCNADVTCFAPASVSTEITPANVVTVNWAPRTDLRPVVNNFELKYGLEGFDPETQGVLIPALNDVNTYTINADLAANTHYDVYVRTVCGTDDQSNWTKSSFTTYPTCWVPDSLTVTGTTQNSATLRWVNNADAPTAATRWEVCYGPEGFGDPEYRGTKVETTNNTAFEVTGLNHTTKYDFYVRSICSATDKSDWSLVATGTTQCGVWQYTDMPLVENFDGYTGNTSGTEANHVMPNCWSWLNGGTNTTYAGLPSIYSTASYSHSTPNSLRFYTYYTTAYADQIAVLPQFGFDLDTIDITLSGRFYNTSSTIQVGVMSDPENAETFETIETLTAPSTGYNTQKPYAVSFKDYAGSARYVAFKVAQPTSGYNGFYMDDLVVKLREKVNVLPDNSATKVVCNEFIMPDTTNGGTYHGNINATYVVRSAQAGYVTRIQGDYDLENGYDFLNVYRGAVNANNLVGRYTGTGSIDYMTNSELWVDSGFVTLVFTSDADNAFTNTGFKFLVTCEQPNANMTPIEDVVEANGTYTWTAGNGETYTQHSTMEASPDRNEDALFWLTNVAGFDSVAHHLTLTLHPTYELNYSHVMCERDEYEFYGQTYNTTGTYTVTLTSQYGADSTGILALQVNPAPMAAISYNNRVVTEINNYCDNANLTLLARSDISNATYVWDDQSTEASRIVNPHESNTYTVISTNSTTGCTSLPASVTVTTTPVPDLTVSGVNEICYGQSTTLTVADANNLDASYVWKKGNTNVGTGTTVTVNPTETTTYTVTATTNNSSACAITAEYTVTVNPLPVIATPTTSVSELCLNESVTLNAEVVEGYTYAWNTGATTAEATTVPTATSAYSVTVTDLNGCVNTFNTAAVTVHPSYELNEERSACIGMLPYTWEAMSLTEAGNFDQHFTIAYGCDSLVHLTFVVEDTAVYNTTRELCEGVSFTFGEGIYEHNYTATESTVITYIDSTSGDCPARYNLILTVNTHNPATVEETVCDTYTWPLTNETFTTSGAYQTTLQTVKGCDSVVTLNLTVNYQNTGIETVTACDNYVWNLNGESYTTSTNEPTFTLQNQWGCDSVVTLNLTVNYRSYHEDFHCVRDSRTYTWLDGETYRLSVNVTDSLEWITGENDYGCNEIALLHLVLNPVIDTLNWVTLDTCDEYEVANAVIFNDEDDCDGHIEPVYLRETGDHELRTRAADGHDQWTRIHLNIQPSTYHTTVATECLPYTWIINDAENNPFEIATITADMVNGAEVYTMSVDLAEAGYVTTGCSSIEVLRLTPKYPTNEVTDHVTICSNGSWTDGDGDVFSGADYASGIYTWNNTTLNEAGCQLNKQVELTVNPVYNETMELVLCENEFTFDADRGLYVDTVYDEKHEGKFVELTYADALNGTPLEGQIATAEWSTENGCDSVVNITFTVNPTTTDTITEVACYEYTWNLTDTRYAEPGTYTEEHKTVNDFGCMHVITLNLTVNDTVFSYDTISVCTSYEYNGQTYRKTMTFRELAGTSVLGCDSVHYVTYEVQQNKLNQQYVVSNKPYTWVNGQTYSQSTDGVYYDVPGGQGECDSVLLLHFTLVNDVIDLCEGELPYTNDTYHFTLSTDAETDVYNNNDPQGNDTIIAYTIRHNIHETVNHTACDSYEWNGDVYTENGEYIDTLDAANGCDSIVTLMLTVNASTHNVETVEVCDTYTWVNNGNTITKSESGVYTSAYTNLAGCASVDTLYLTINKNAGVEETEAACVTYNWIRTGVDYTESGDYSVSFTDVNGCVGDSVLHLTINQPIVVNETLVVNSDTASYRFNGELYTAPYDGTITVETVSTVTGCDSTYNLHLIIPFINYIDTLRVNACGTYTWEADGHTYGWISVAERQSHGMALFKDLTDNRYVYSYPVDTTFIDGVMTKIEMLLLNVMESTTSVAEPINVPLSLGSYSIMGVAGDVEGQVVKTITYNRANIGTPIVDTVGVGSVAYCDDYRIFTLNVIDNYDTTDYYVCSDATTYEWNDETYNVGEPGHTYFFTQKENEGTLDELVHVRRVNQRAVNAETITEVACDSFTWTEGNGETYTESVSGVVYNYTDSNQCAATKTLNLTVKYNTNTAVTKDECDTYTWTAADGGNGQTYTTSGDYTKAYTATNGCPSVDTLHLTIRNNTSQGYTVAECNSYIWERNGETYTTGGDKYYEYNAVNGCPSVDTLHLTINLPTNTGYTVDDACNAYTWNNTEYTVSGTYYYEYNTEAGCASVDTLYLTVNTSTYNSETFVQCDSLQWNGTWYNESGLYTYAYTNDEGCASVDTLHLTINVNNTGVEVTETACDEYTWELNQNRQYTTSGDWSFVSTDVNGCRATNVLHLTINHTSSYDSTLWVSEGSYRYTAQDGTQTLYEPGVYTLTETYANAEGCDSTLNITLKVGNYNMGIDVVTNCSRYTWRNGKTYTWLSMADRTAHANTDGDNAIYYNETDQEYVYYNPMYTVPQENDYDSVYILNLTLTQSMTTQDVVNFPISLGILTYGDSIFDFSSLNGIDFVNATEYREVHFHSDYYCDSIVDLTINLVNNYVKADSADICVTENSYTWRGQTISTATTDFDHAHNYYIYEVQENEDSLLTTVEYLALTQHPVVYSTERRTACDSYTWNGQTYTESTSNATYNTVDRFGCDSTVTLMLTINKNTNTTVTVPACETYTWLAAEGGNGETYTESGTYTYDYYTDKGCPSTNTLVLTVNNKTNTAYVVNECDSYTWENGNGQTYSATTYDVDTILFSYPDADNICTSVDTLYLTLRHNTNTTVTKTACDSYTWTAADKGNDEVYTESGEYTYEYTAENGCPSVNTLNLTINVNAGHSDQMIACDSIEWHGVKYYTTGNYTYDYTDGNNCASIDTLELTINQATHNVATVVECNSYTWTEGTGDTYTTSGTYTYSYDNELSCPSVDTLHLTIGSGRAFGYEYVTVCGPYTWVVNGEEIATLDESVETSTTVTNPATGCDSTIYLYLTVNPQNITTDTICDNQTYTWTVNNTVYSAAGTYNVPVLDNNGNCESEEVLVLTVNETKVTNLTDQICLGNGYNANGFDIAASELAAAGEYTFTLNLFSAAGCDSTVNLTLTVGDVINNLVEAVACDSYAWTAGDGQTYNYTVSGTYNSEAYANAEGCTTVDVLTLTINNNSSTEYTETVCDGYMWNGTQYTESGDYTYDYTDGNGCASTDVLHLTVNNSVINTIEKLACDSYEWTDGNGETYTATGVYTYNYTTPDGCTAVDYLVLTISNSYTNTEYVRACDSYTYGDAIYTETAVIVDSNLTAAGCDSIITVNLTINNHASETINEKACGFFNWHGETYTESTEATWIGTAANGCDSVVTLKLTVNQPVATSFEVSVCGSYIWNDVEYTTSGNYTQTLQTIDGCDSTVTMNLTINPAVVNSFSQMACESFTWNDVVYTESGDYTQTLQSVDGCDSIVNMYLTINHGQNTFDTVMACDSYLWNGVDYTEDGTYTIDITDGNGCAAAATLVLVVNESKTGSVTAEACTHYTWTEGNGQTYATSGDYEYVATSVDGCDSIVTLHLTINTPVNIIIDTTACSFFEWDGSTYRESGSYSRIYTASTGCDSTVTMNVTIHNTAFSTETVVACGSYQWNGETYTASGTYFYEVENGAANGCDSIATLVLTLTNPQSISDTVVACDSYEWINGQTYNASGTYTYTIPGDECDGVATLHLTISESVETTETASACAFYNWKGQTYTESGTYTWNGTNAAGCDSIVTLVLTISDAVTATETAEACEFYNWNGQTYTQSGTYTWTGTNAGGCDSIVTLTLTINQPVTSSFSATACESYTWNDETYTISGNYTQTLQNVNGCDSVVTLNLTINNGQNTTENVVACESYLWNGTVYTESGVYTVDINDGNGCTAVATLTLTINQPVAVTVNDTACSRYHWNGVEYTTSGDYTFTTTAANGCDSITTLMLTINQPMDVIDTVIACDNYLWNGALYITSGTYTHNFTDANGCAAVETLELTLNESANDLVTVTACEAFTWNGETYEASGIYTYNTTAANGCDSVVTLDLTILETISETIVASACGSYTFNGDVYTTSGEYVYTAPAANGCDSIVTLNLTINQPVTETVYETACGSFDWNGQTFNTSGSYIFDTVASNGCDSTVTLILTLNAILYDTTEVTAIERYVWNDNVYTESGVYTVTFTASNGCDSVAVLMLTITEPDYTVTLATVNEAMGTVSPAGATVVAPGTVFTATATANEGYHFVAWVSGTDTVSRTATYQFTVNANITLTAVFAHDPIVYYVITAVANDANMGLVLGSGEYEAGATVTLVARPRSGYHFVNWSNGVTDTLITFVATENVTLVANFAADPVGIDDIDEDAVSIYSVDNRIIVNGAENMDVYVYDVNGRCLRHQANANETVEFTMNASGVYLVKVGTLPAKRVVVVR